MLVPIASVLTVQKTLYETENITKQNIKKQDNVIIDYKHISLSS